MANLEITTPNNWILDEDSALCREWVPQVFKRDCLDYAEENKDTYDFKSIFYSISYCRNRGHFYAIGPLLLNLHNDVLPMSARYSIDGGKSYEAVACAPIDKSVSIGLTIQLMQVGELDAPELILELELANGAKKSFTIANPKPKPASLVMNTLQKDNEVSWIVDWVNYYRSYGVFEFHIYDNGSTNFDSVVDALRTQISDDTYIKIVNWPYRYGVPKLGQSQFTQKSSILDFILQNQHAGWVINCDIDEYIFVNPRHNSLQDFFAQYDETVGCIQFGSSDAPLVQVIDYPEDLTIRDLVWRMKMLKEKFKNGFRPAVTVTAATHFVNLEAGLQSVFPDSEEAFYLHALPLNTGWEQPNKRRVRRILEERRMVNDTRIADRMAEIDLQNSTGKA